MPLTYRFYTCDVFTDTRFGGNPLAVLPHADGLSAGQMQRIAREFNFSETTFVLEPAAGHTRRVRIFTPQREVPFAGHPNIGTASVLAATGELGEIGAATSVTFEEEAGVVPIHITAGDGILWCGLSAPQPLTLGEALPDPVVARALSLGPGDVVSATHPPQVCSVGLPFVIAELSSVTALSRARVDLAGFDAIMADGIRPSIYLYVGPFEGDRLRARMFAPLSGVWEDPATGSAGCAVAGLLAQHHSQPTGEFEWHVTQGVEIGRRSELVVRAVKERATVTETGVSGSAVLVSDGHIRVD